MKTEWRRKLEFMPKLLVSVFFLEIRWSWIDKISSLESLLHSYRIYCGYSMSRPKERGEKRMKWGTCSMVTSNLESNKQKETAKKPTWLEKALHSKTPLHLISPLRGVTDDMAVRRSKNKSSRLLRYKGVLCFSTAGFVFVYLCTRVIQEKWNGFVYLVFIPPSIYSACFVSSCRSPEGWLLCKRCWAARPFQGREDGVSLGPE